MEKESVGIHQGLIHQGWGGGHSVSYQNVFSYRLNGMGTQKLSLSYLEQGL